MTFEEKSARELATVKRDWGDDEGRFLGAAHAAVKASAWSLSQVEAIEKAIGTDAMLRGFAAIGLEIGGPE